MQRLAIAETAVYRETLDVRELPAERVQGLYVHVPFCFHKCHYCDFYSITRQTAGRMKRYVDLVLAEAEIWPASPLKLEFETAYIGGGTPSLLGIDQMRRLLAGLRERFDLSRLREWTVEVNPATADLEWLRTVREYGVDRISLGAQSFDRGELEALERHHDPADVGRGVALARQAGFERINVDLIYAIPGQTLASWRRSLAEALALGTDHLSCYGLTYEPNTPLAVRRRLGRIQAAPEALEIRMLREARRAVGGAGMVAYEISNFARPGCESLHNLAYWLGESYVGLGPSAASHIHGRRFRNAPHLGRWEAATSGGGLPVIDLEHLTPRQRAGELAMLNLRLARGIDLGDFALRTGMVARDLFSDAIGMLVSQGLLEAGPQHIRLTDKALPVADAIASEFLAATKTV